LESKTKNGQPYLGINISELITHNSQLITHNSLVTVAASGKMYCGFREQGANGLLAFIVHVDYAQIQDLQRFGKFVDRFRKLNDRVAPKIKIFEGVEVSYRRRELLNVVAVPGH